MTTVQANSISKGQAMVLYALRHPTSGLVKLGRTSDFKRRYQQHCWEQQVMMEVVHVSACESGPDAYEAIKQRENWLMLRTSLWRLKRTKAAGRKRSEWCRFPDNVLRALPTLMDEVANAVEFGGRPWMIVTEALQRGEELNS